MPTLTPPSHTQHYISYAMNPTFSAVPFKPLELNAILDPNV